MNIESQYTTKKHKKRDIPWCYKRRRNQWNGDANSQRNTKRKKKRRRFIGSFYVFNFIGLLHKFLVDCDDVL